MPRVNMFHALVNKQAVLWDTHYNLQTALVAASVTMIVFFKDKHLKNCFVSRPMINKTHPT